MAADQFLLGALHAGNTVEKISLNERNLSLFLSCKACSGRNCSCVSDDKATIIDRMLAADVIVFSMPEYSYNMNKYIKKFFACSFPSYPELKNKQVFFIGNGADSTIFDLPNQNTACHDLNIQHKKSRPGWQPPETAWTHVNLGTQAYQLGSAV